MDALIVEHAWPVAGMLVGLSTHLTMVGYTISQSRGYRVWPWRVIRERQMRSFLSLVGAIGLMWLLTDLQKLLPELPIYTAFGGFGAGLAAEKGIDIARERFSARAGMGMTPPTSLNDTTIIRPPRDDTTERRP